MVDRRRHEHSAKRRQKKTLRKLFYLKQIFVFGAAAEPSSIIRAAAYGSSLLSFFFLPIASPLSARGRSAKGLRINTLLLFKWRAVDRGCVCSFASYLTQRGRWEAGGLADKRSAEVCLAPWTLWGPARGPRADARRCWASAQAQMFHFS